MNKKRYGHVSKEEIEQIHLRTGVPKVIIKKCLKVFSKGFKNYLKGPMEVPFYLKKVFTIYKSKGKKTDDMIKNWRGNDKDLPYKK